VGKLKSEQQRGNVNVTLGSKKAGLGEMEEKEFPCPLCGEGLPARISKRQKPYFTCNKCGVQMFVRGKAGILRLNEMANAGILISGKDGSTSRGISLLNRLEQLKLQKKDLSAKRGIIFTDENVENVIRIVDVEIEKIESELARITVKTESQTNK
jgi:predicted RNA-binding Zn-ribbon protein involved in translation (DUF1610 family)